MDSQQTGYDVVVDEDEAVDDVVHAADGVELARRVDHADGVEVVDRTYLLQDEAPLDQLAQVGLQLGFLHYLSEEVEGLRGLLFVVEVVVGGEGGPQERVHQVSRLHRVPLRLPTTLLPLLFLHLSLSLPPIAFLLLLLYLTIRLYLGLWWQEGFREGVDAGSMLAGYGLLVGLLELLVFVVELLVLVLPLGQLLAEFVIALGEVFYDIVFVH